MRPMVFVLGLCLVGAAIAQEMPSKEDYANLAKALPTSKVSLAQGIENAAKGGGTVLSAKFEVEEGKFALSIYTAAKSTDGKQTFAEWAGDPAAEKWAPESEEIKDEGDVKNATDQVAALAKAKKTFADILKAVDAEKAGTAFSITPVIKDGKAMFVVLVAGKTEMATGWYDAVTGEKAKSPK